MGDLMVRFVVRAEGSGAAADAAAPGYVRSIVGGGSAAVAGPVLDGRQADRGVPPVGEARLVAGPNLVGPRAPGVRVALAVELRAVPLAAKLANGELGDRGP